MNQMTPPDTKTVIFLSVSDLEDMTDPPTPTPPSFPHPTSPSPQTQIICTTQHPLQSKGRSLAIPV